MQRSVSDPQPKGTNGGNLLFDSSGSSNDDLTEVSEWSVVDVSSWLDTVKLSRYKGTFSEQKLDGLALLLLTEDDIKQDLGIKVLGDLKRLCSEIGKLKNVESKLQSSPVFRLDGSCIRECRRQLNAENNRLRRLSPIFNANLRRRTYSSDSPGEPADPRKRGHPYRYMDRHPPHIGGLATNLKPEYLKTVISCLYMLLVTWITAVVMVYAHDRVPDRNRHPPLPDIFLDNVPHISWAFQLCEVAILLLIICWLFILFFHKHSSILLRRFSALSGSVFLLRCATMFITSLSVPGHHLECSPREETDFWTKLDQAWIIWCGGGLSIKGVRTCGDYMFSGHTTALTLLNFFITEYTPRRMYFLHIASWVLNTFGIFFILAAHEHYSIDVFIAFYITSRMFLYYHSLANNRALHQRDSFRTKIWFPMFSFFEFNIDGIVPNEYENPLSFSNLNRLYWWFGCLFYRLKATFNCTVGAKKRRKTS